ncbi:MAG: SurA N-terminal domain-containing protein [Hyphomicrobiales bacterium]
MNLPFPSATQSALGPYGRLAIVCLGLLMLVAPAGTAPLLAQGSGRLIAIVNDEPISEYDLSQRVKMNKTLSSARGSAQQQRKAALKQLVENTLKRQEAKRLKLTVKPNDVERSLTNMASRAGITQQAWTSRLKSGGVAVSTIKKEIESSLSWRRVVQARFGRRIQVETADVDREYQRVAANPGKSQKFYVLKRIILPLQKNATEALRRTRLTEAHRIIKRFKGCSRAKQAASGIFDVKLQRSQTVPSESVPKDLRKALDRAGPGRAVGPGPAPQGIIIIAYCERKVVEAPKITKESVEQQLLYRKFDRIGAQFLSDLRRDAVIEYKDDGLRS